MLNIVDNNKNLVVNNAGWCQTEKQYTQPSPEAGCLQKLHQEGHQAGYGRQVGRKRKKERNNERKKERNKERKKERKKELKRYVLVNIDEKI